MASWLASWFTAKEEPDTGIKDAVKEHKVAAEHAEELAKKGSREARDLLRMSENALAILDKIERKKKAS